GSWTGVESVENPVNPAAVGQSVVVYTYAALKAALQSAKYAYIEFGANLAYGGTNNTEALITIAPSRDFPELTVNAKGYTFGTTRTGNNVIRFAGSSSGSNLTQITYRDWNVPDFHSSYGILNLSSTRAVTVVFDGLTFAGPQLATVASASNIIFNGARQPVDVTITRPGNTGDTAAELIDGGSDLIFEGDVTLVREDTGSSTSALFAGFETVTVRGAGTQVSARDNRAQGLFVTTTPVFRVESGASFAYRGNRRFTSANLSSLTVGPGATFDLRASGAIASTALLRVGGNLIIEDNANFVVVSENNTASNTLPVVSTGGNISIRYPRSFLVYQSGTSTNAGARTWNFTSGKSFLYIGAGLARWDAVQGALPPADGAYARPAAYWTNWDAAPITIAGTTASNGKFTNLNITEYDREANTREDFSFAGKIISNIEKAPLGRYVIQYWSTATATQPETPMNNILPDQRGYCWPDQPFSIPLPSVDGYRRVVNQPTEGFYVPGTQTIRAYYESLGIIVDPIELEKTAVRLGDNEWEVTLAIKSDSTIYTPILDLDIMLTLDRSDSMTTARRNAVRAAAISMVDALSSNERLLGRVRIGVVQFASNNATSSRLVLPLSNVRNAGAVAADGVTAAKNAIIEAFSDTNASTYMNLGIDHAHNELYNSARTSEYSLKYIVLLTDGQATNTSAARTSANNYKAHADGQLITIGLETTTSATNLLKEIQNAGYYAATDSNVSQVFADIVEAIIIAGVQSGVVVDPVGDGFVFLSATGAPLPASGAVDGYVAASQGTVVLETRDGKPTLVWELASHVDGAATLTYRVRLANPEASKNLPLPTNGPTTLSYVDVDGKPQVQNFDVPVVVYGVSKLTVAYEGAIPAAQRPAPTVIGPINLYQAPVPSPQRLTAPPQQFAGFALTSVTLTGSEVIDDRVVTWDLSAATLPALVSLVNEQVDGRIEIVHGIVHEYYLPLPVGDLTLAYHYDRPVEYEIVYHNVNGVPNPNPASYTVLDTPAALQGLTGRPGYTFTGWYADAGYTVKVTGIEAGGLEDRDYWAKWGDGGSDTPNKPDVYTITYQNLNGAANPNPTSYTIIDTPRSLKPLVLAGYTFEGWYADGAYTTPAAKIEAGGTGHRTLWAKWSGADVYTITYHNAQGAPNPNPTSYTISSAPLVLSDLKGRPGYTFDGWYADPGYTVRVSSIEAGGTDDRDYWAKWGDGGPDNPNKPDVYTITYHMLSGDPVSPTLNPGTYTIIDTPIRLKAPALNGYAGFDWYDAKGVRVTRIAEGTTGDLEFWGDFSLA
ncbi:MAG: InlB B-repeat-containing protein, partial [Oscillospiraceae bacterium]|nr:InlB B-repeat-containing protein [Oscillospiraceae bacterium]